MFERLKDLLKIEKHTYYEVVYAEDLPLCPDCLDPWCPKCKLHYCDCHCIGPTEDNVDYIEWQGKLYGRRINNGK